MQASSNRSPKPAPRPRTLTVFAAAFVAGAAAAVGINSALDVHLSQKKPQVESEPIFVALRSLPQGSPVTVWDVALKDWPKAMLPATAMRAEDTFEGLILRHPLREGQPLLSVQLVRANTVTGQSGDGMTFLDVPFTPPTPAAPPAADADLWAPAETVGQAAPIVQPVPRGETVAPKPEPAAAVQTAPTTTTDIAPAVAEPPAIAATEPVTAAEPVAVQQLPPTEPSATIEVAAQPRTEPTFAEPVATAPVDDEPTPATPSTGQPTPADTAGPAMPDPLPEPALESVVAAEELPGEPGTAAVAVPTPDEPQADSQPTAAAAPPARQTSRDAVARYLVVPERIAMQADAGFSRPPAATEPPQPAAQPAMKSVPPVQASPAAQPRPNTQPVRRPVQPKQPQKTQPQTRKAQPPSQPTPQNRRPTAENPRGFGAMFPNIAAGIDRVGSTFQRARSQEPQYDEAVATDDPSFGPR